MSICIHNMERVSCAYCGRVAANRRHPIAVARPKRTSSAPRPTLLVTRDLALLIRRDLLAHPGSTVREITKRLHDGGISAQKRDVNSTLYRLMDAGWRRQVVPGQSAPRWSATSLASEPVARGLAGVAAA